MFKGLGAVCCDSEVCYIALQNYLFMFGACESISQGPKVTEKLDDGFRFIGQERLCTV